MNWFLVCCLSFSGVFGLSAISLFDPLPQSDNLDYWLLIIAIAITSILGLTSGVEMLLWALFGLICAIIIVYWTDRYYFGHGFIVGLVVGALATFLQYLFWPTLAVNNPASYHEIASLPLERDILTWGALSLFLGMTRGIALGLFTWFVARLLRRKPKSRSENNKPNTASATP